MMSASNSTTEKYEVCFVQIKNISEEARNRLKLAFEAMESKVLEPRWITSESCLKMKKKAERLFVLDPFEGKVYKHLQSNECRIVGPLCILGCLELGDSLPKRPHSVYSIAMRRITISCSNLDKELRNDLSEKIVMMGGRFSKDLTKTVTHLIAGEVGSKKYHVAANFGLPIMLPSWVIEVWEHSQYEQLHAGDSFFDKFRCPIFKGLSITVSQFDTHDRKKYKALIEKNGGRYSGAMKSKDTTHLVLLEAKGDKYNFAKSWKLHCVKAAWIDDSVKAGYCMDESLYTLSSDTTSDEMHPPPPPKRSTPIKDAGFISFSIDCSAINGTLCQVEETMQSDISTFFTEKTRTSYGVLDAFDTSTLPKSGEFLDGCKIFLTGFKTAHIEKLRKIVNAGGGIRFSNYSESVTHVICGEKCNPQLFDAIKASSVKPHLLTFDWLLLCCKQEKLVDEGPFSYPDLTSISPQKVEKQRGSQTNESLPCVKDFPINDDFSDILGQYASQKSSDSLKENNPLGNKQITVLDAIELAAEQNTDVPTVSNLNVENDTREPQETITSNLTSAAESVVDNLLEGKIFRVTGFDTNEKNIISDLILSHGGFISASGDIKADVAIVPLIWTDFDLNTSVVVTNCWLQKSIEENTILQFNENELFIPFQFDLSVQPLKNLIISISQYSGTERDCLMHLAKMLGAQCQDYFVRKANLSRDLFPNTHLVASTPEGSKYEASVKWNIPAVTKYWLLAAAKTNSVPPVEKYVVGVEMPKDSTLFSDIISFNKNEMSDSKKSVTSDNVFSTPVKTKQHELDIMQNVLNKDAAAFIGNNRVKELIDNNKANVSTDYSSPERFIVENYKPRFDVQAIFKCLNLTPSSDSSDNERNKSLPLSEVFSRNLSMAVKNARKKHGFKPLFDSSMSDSNCTVGNTSLNGVVVCVAKKLENLQLDINKMVKSLGGEFLWTFDNSCTHYVFQGKANDLSKEYRQAKRMGKKIVSPEWIYACEENGTRLSETNYPHTLKSKLSPLKISTTKFVDNSPSKAVEDKKVEESITSEVVTRSTEKKQVNSIDVSEQLDEIIVAAKSAKAGKRRTRMSTTSGDSPLESGVRYGTRSNTSSPVFKNIYEATVTNVKHDIIPSEPSQGMPITWDDPMGRMEREKIAAEVANANSSSNEDDLLEKNNSIPSEPIEAKNLSHVVGPKKFMFSLLSEAEKQHYSSLIGKLGGEVSNCMSFDPSATHLITKQVTRNEKFISSIASGKWVLHPSYVDDSITNEKFLDETLYEWDGDSRKTFIANQSESSLPLLLAAKRWRLKIQGAESFPFDGWKVVVLAPVKKKEGYCRILLAGGAQIIPFSSAMNSKDIKYAFVEVRSNAELVSELKSLLVWGVKCLKAEYLASYLIDEPPPAPNSYFITECKDSSDESMSSKRRAPATSNRDRKKTRFK